MDFMAFAKSLKLPTIAFATKAVSGLVVIVANSAVLRAMYPYYACILTFAASVPDIRKRFMESIAPVFDKFQTVKDGTERKVEGIADKGLNYLAITEKAMNNALAPIKDKLSLATQFETLLKQFNPDIDIPGKIHSPRKLLAARLPWCRAKLTRFVWMYDTPHHRHYGH